MYLFIYSLVNLFIIAIRVDNYTHAQIEKAPPKKICTAFPIYISTIQFDIKHAFTKNQTSIRKLQ